MWQGILGHDEVAERFRTAVRRGRLASTYLFVGPPGVGKRRFALALAKALLCRETQGDPLEPCGRCESCRLCVAASHPDLDVVSLPKDKSTLPLELFIGSKEHRNQEGLCHRIALRPFLGGRKVAIIDDADNFSQESANALLKTLEEPPPRSLLILIGTSPSKQLPTIRSRSQIVRFQPLSSDTVAEILVRNAIVPDHQSAAPLIEFGAGSIERAAALVAPAIWQFRGQMLRDLANEQANPVRLAKAIQGFVDEAGKDAADRRERLRTILTFAEDFYRGRLRAEANGAPGDALGALDASLRAAEHIDRNANLALVIQRWCEEVAVARSPI
jgi:DNA polymerase III subunit delta'